MELIIFTGALFLSLCEAAITPLIDVTNHDTLEIKKPFPMRGSNLIDSRSINNTRNPADSQTTADSYDVSHYSIVRNDKTLIGNPSKSIASYLVFSRCPDNSELVIELLKPTEHSVELSLEEIRAAPNEYGDKLFSYHDKPHHTFRLHIGDRSVVEYDLEYYWYSHIVELCKLSVFEVYAAPAFEIGDPYGKTFTEIGVTKLRKSFFKVKKEPTVKPMCLGVAATLIWGQTRLIIGHFTDGVSFFSHPGEACNTDFEHPISEIQILRVAYDLGTHRVTLGCKKGLARQWKMHHFDSSSTDIHNYLNSIGDKSQIEINNIGIWYSGIQDVDTDITVTNISSYEYIYPVKKNYDNSFVLNGLRRLFTRVGILSTTPQKFVAKITDNLSGTLCGGFGFVDTEPSPQLLAAYFSNGLLYWNETIGSCSERYDIVAKEVSLRAQLLTESVKVGVKKDSETELVFEISTTGIEWYEDFNILGFVHSSAITYHILPAADDMTDLKTNSCTLHSHCESYQRCNRPFSRAPRWGTCRDIVDNCSEDDQGVPRCTQI